MSEPKQAVSEGNSPIVATGEPMALFAAWFDEARRAEPEDPDAAALATTGADGAPNVRMVLIKGADAAGFVFYTNRESIKGAELAANPKAALCFHWKSLHRQVRVRGAVTAISDAESDAYFASRPKTSQLGAWASQQSRPLPGRFVLETAVARYAAQYALSAVPRPPYWGGFRLAPLAVEFWQIQPFRLHDRLLYSRATLDVPWHSQRLYP